MKPLLVACALSTAGMGSVFLLSSSKDAPTELNALKAQQAVRSAQASTNKNAYFGDLHLHTDLSFDAYIFGTRLTIDDAYKFAKGETLEADGEKLKREFPLDFFAVTDHSEGLGVARESADESSLLYASELGKKLRTDTTKGFAAFTDYLRPVFRQKSLGDLVPGFDQEKVVISAWRKVIETANKNYEPGKFTTFTAYEWSSGFGGNQMVHRNVIFKGTQVPNAPFSSADSDNPEDLWDFLENNRKQGREALAISHNANASNGFTFDWVDRNGKALTKEHAEKRAYNEPLNEITQNKGSSETHPLLSTNDEFANYEIIPYTAEKDTSKVHGSYAREALGRGLLLKESLGVNPFKFGAIGSTDLHGSLTTTNEQEYNGTITTRTVDPSKSLGYKKGARSGNVKSSSGALAGVWAEENTRESIYNALRRKETFATSGTRLRFRFFGGWDYTPALLKDKDWVGKAYAAGVPMGGDLPAKPSKTKAPSFVVWAIKDPSHANLDRVQVVKVWIKGGKNYEKIFDVALADGRKVDAKTGKTPAVGNTVDTKNATYTNSIGDTELSTVWTDPEFDASLLSVYYIRVLEIPTPRWSTYVAAKNNLPLPENVPASIQERGWSSPIWYTPSN